MRLGKKYLQFNDLVIDNYDMLGSANESVEFKTQNHSYSYGDGAYTAFKSDTAFAQPKSLAMTLNLNRRKLKCNEYNMYIEYVQSNLMKPGKLWAVQGEQLLYAYAYITSFAETYTTNQHSIAYDVNFILYEGVWHVANPLKVFLKPFDPCVFDDCNEYYHSDGCENYCPTCPTVPEQTKCPKCECECGYLTADNSFCSMKKEAVSAFYNTCNSSYRIMYNCKAAAKVFGDESLWGKQICSTNEHYSIISGRIYSGTVKNTENVTIRIVGNFKDPMIEFNGRTMIVKGSYNGMLVITPSGEVYFTVGAECDMRYVTPDNIVIPEGNDYGFVAHHGNNTLFIQNLNCNSRSCAYVDIGAVVV